MKKTILSVLSILSLITSVISAKKPDVNVLENWEVILSNEKQVFWYEYNTVFRALKDASRKQQSWCVDLNALFDRMLTASEAGNLDAYKNCFDGKTGSDDELKAEMTTWKEFKHSLRLKKCAWFKSKNFKILVTGMVVATGNKKRGVRYPDNADYMKYLRMRLRKVIYAKKNENGYKFTTDFKDKELENLIETEVYINLQDKYRTKKEYELYKKLVKQREEERSAKLKKQALSEHFCRYKKNRPILMQKYGYSEKKMRELYIESKKRNADIYMDKLSVLQQFKRGLSIGHIKVFSKPVLFKINNIPTTAPPPLSFIDIIRKELKRLKKTYYQFIAYERIKFSGRIYYDVIGVCYNNNKNDIIATKTISGYIYDKNKHSLLIPQGLDRKLSRSYNSYQPIKRVLSRYRMKAPEYDEALKKAKLYRFFRIRKPAECILYKPGLDILKLPTIPAEDFNFPELEK